MLQKEVNVLESEGKDLGIAACRVNKQGKEDMVFYVSHSRRVLVAQAIPQIVNEYSERIDKEIASDAYIVRTDRLIRPVRTLAWRTCINFESQPAYCPLTQRKRANPFRLIASSNTEGVENRFVDVCSEDRFVVRVLDMRE